MAAAASILADLAGGGAGQLVSGIGTVINAIRGKDPAAAAALQAAVEQHGAEFRLAELQSQVALAGQQADVDKVEAARDPLFVSGWRPFIGWVCGAALVFQFVMRPLLTWGAALSGHAIAVPSLDMGDLFTLMAGMLGLGAFRTAEKIKGADGVAVKA